MTAKQRDLAALEAFTKPTTAVQRRSANYRQRMRDAAHAQGLPPRLAKHAASLSSMAKVTAFAEQHAQGCHLSGQPLQDKLNPKDPHPNATVLRKDGTMVSYAIWLLSQEGLLPDNLLVNAAVVISQHQQRKHSVVKKPQPSVVKIQHPPNPPQPEPDYGISSLFAMGPEHRDDRQPSDPIGQRQPTSPGYGAGALYWDDSAQAMVRAPV